MILLCVLAVWIVGDKVVVGFSVRERSRKRPRIILVEDNDAATALCRNEGWLSLPIIVIELEAKIEFTSKVPHSDKVILLVETS
jgi:hypothetical protein